MIDRDVTVQSQSEIVGSYDRFYSEPGRLRDSDAFYRWVLDKLGPVPGSALLDVACGEGHLLRFAEARGVRAMGMDFSPVACRLARQFAGEEGVTIADGERLPFAEQTFDYVTNLGSLEHFGSPERGLSEMRRVLKPGGAAALVLPNSYYLLDILWHVWRRGYPVSHKQMIERFATAGEWRDLIQAHGFRVRHSLKYNFCWPRSSADFKWYARYPRKIPYFALSLVTPFNLSYSFLFICEPA